MNSEIEDDKKEVISLCPMDLRKLNLALNFNILKRYENIE